MVCGQMKIKENLLRAASLRLVGRDLQMIPARCQETQGGKRGLNYASTDRKEEDKRDPLLCSTSGADSSRQ